MVTNFCSLQLGNDLWPFELGLVFHIIAAICRARGKQAHLSLELLEDADILPARHAVGCSAPIHAGAEVQG